MDLSFSTLMSKAEEIIMLNPQSHNKYLQFFSVRSKHLLW